MQDQWAKFHLVIQGSKEILGSSPDKFQGLEICQVILDNIQEEKNPRDDWGDTPLHEAAKKGHTEIACLIVENVAENPRNDEGDTPLHEAARRGHTEIASLIVENVDVKRQST